MVKVLIVDDEPLVQVGIKSMIEQSPLDLTVCGIASNGQAALTVINEEKPEIVITDIKMPIMSGLQLAEECQKKYGSDSPSMVVLTSYEDFNLVRQAMHLSIKDYLVKLELTPELLNNTLSKIIEEIEAREPKDEIVKEEPKNILSSYSDKFFISLLHNLFENREQFSLEAEELRLSFDSPAYVCSYMEVIDDSGTRSSDNLTLYHSAFEMSRKLFERYYKSYAIQLDLHHFAVVFCLNETDSSSIIKNISETISNVSAALKSYYSTTLQAGTGTLVYDPLTITESYQYARDAFSNTDNKNKIVSFDQCQSSLDSNKSFNFSIFKDSLSKAYEEFDHELLAKTLTDITDLFKSHPGHYLQSMDAASNILYMSISLIPNGEEVVSGIFCGYNDGYRGLYKLTTMDQIINWLNFFKDALVSYFIEHKKDTRKPIVANIKHYIKENTTDHLSLNEVAAVFGISPNYLSQLFKKYNDCGYNEYVTNCKIDKARHLLASGDYKVYEVAELLGFENAFYFSKVFKKVVGVPPTTFMAKE